MTLNQILKSATLEDAQEWNNTDEKTIFVCNHIDLSVSDSRFDKWQDALEARYEDILESVKTPFKKGQKLKSRGLDMKCNPVIVTAEFHEYLPESEVKEFEAHDGKPIKQDCVIRTDGFLMITDSSSLWV